MKLNFSNVHRYSVFEARKFDVFRSLMNMKSCGIDSRMFETSKITDLNDNFEQKRWTNIFSL